MPNNLFVQFTDILQKFDPTKETPIDLYKKIEQLFGEEHKYFADEFLMFLTPGQAVEMGRFMDYFTMVQLSSFIQMLQVACLVIYHALRLFYLFVVCFKYTIL